MGSLPFSAEPVQTCARTALGVQGAARSSCLVRIQVFTSRTVGQRIPRVIWQKMQVELFPEREPRDSPCRAVVRPGWVPAGS
jgi:hypothetical protein